MMLDILYASGHFRSPAARIKLPQVKLSQTLLGSDVLKRDSDVCLNERVSEMITNKHGRETDNSHQLQQFHVLHEEKAEDSTNTALRTRTTSQHAGLRQSHHLYVERTERTAAFQNYSSWPFIIITFEIEINISCKLFELFIT